MKGSSGICVQDGKKDEPSIPEKLKAGGKYELQGFGQILAVTYRSRSAGRIAREPSVCSFQCGRPGRCGGIHDEHLLRAGKIEPDKLALPFLLRRFKRLPVLRF